MRKIKKALALSLALAMGLSLVACGDSTEESTTTAAPTEAASEEDTDAASEDASEEDTTDADSTDAASIAAPSTDGWTEDNKIYCYTWDDTFQKKIDIVLEKYPDYKDYVEVVNLGVGGTSDDYKTQVDTALESGDKYPDIITADNDVAKYWSETDSTMDLTSIGFTSDVLANSYDFATQYGTTSDGALKTVTWQANPGTVFYRRDIAKEVLGSDDPETVQAALADWDTFFETADTLKAAGYKIVSGPADVKYAIWDTTQSQKWVTDDGALQLDDAVSTYLETGKKIYDGEYSNNTSLWDSSWAADMQDSSKVFCFFGCPWFIGSMQGNGATDGNWGACTGPAAGYHWGGTYCMVGANSKNTELDAFILWALTCDVDVSVEIANQLGECPNNKAAIEALTTGGQLASDNNAATFLGGQNPFELWVDSIADIDLSNLSYQDASIKNYIDEAATAYNSGEIGSVDDAVQYVKDKCATELSLTVE